MADRCRVGLQTVDYSEGSNEITLYKDNRPILKAECGITLGLLKLIYSTDDAYSGILLGVKPRLLNGELPCLVTFDNTSLTHPEYDLIVQAVPSPEHTQSTASRERVSAVTQRPVLSEVNIASSERSHAGNHRTHKQISGNQSVSSRSQTQSDVCSNVAPCEGLGSSSDDLCGDIGHDHWSSPSSTNLSPGPGPEAFSPGRPLPAQHEHVSPEKLPFVDCEVNDPPDSTVQESNISGFVLSTETRLCDGVVDGDRADEKSETLEPDFKAPAEIQFNPEDFNFDIGSVVPFQSDKGTRWPCDQCSKDFCSSSHLKRHWILHTDFKPYKCNVCNKCFPFQWDIKRHMTTHTGDKRFKCPLCPKSFNTQKELGNHNWSHTGKKEYQCHVCHHEFSAHSNLKIHMRKHTGEKPYKCEYCPKAFHMQGHYQYHVRHHTGEKPYHCDTCGKTFSYSHNLNEHKNVHTGYRPYSCSHCDKKFTHRSTFKQHVLMHEGFKRYKCHVCSKCFLQSSNYQRHILTHKNKEERIQKCDLCGKELLSRRGIQKHRLRCVKMTVERAKASESTSKKSRLKRGEYHCEHCPRIFANYRNLETHVTKKHSPSTEGAPKKPSRKANKPKKRSGKANRSIEPSGEANVPDVSTKLWKKPPPVLRFQCSDCGRRFGYAKRLQEHQAMVHHHGSFHGGTSPADTQTSTSHANTTGNYVFIVPKPAVDQDNILPPPSAGSHLTGSPAITVPRETASNSHYASDQTGDRFLQPDETDKQEAGETGFEALSALGRLSAKIGIEGNLFN
ncbi:hypothetical protein ACROYT_G003339 [Oculina patagonica]